MSDEDIPTEAEFAAARKVAAYRARISIAEGRSLGGRVRAARLSPERRSEIARQAAQKRWSK